MQKRLLIRIPHISKENFADQSVRINRVRSVHAPKTGASCRMDTGVESPMGSNLRSSLVHSLRPRMVMSANRIQTLLGTSDTI